MATLAFVGLGNMGLPMALNLVKAGHTVRAFDLNEAAVAKAVEGGAENAASITHAVDGAAAVVSMLPAGRHVEAVYTQADGLFESAAQGTLMIDCSTIDVETARRVNAAARDKGMAMVDAPVSGGIMAAEAGSLTFMVGGAQDAFSRARPLLEAMGKTIVHAGDAGTGQAAKICNNMLLGISMIGVAEAFVLAEKLGLDWQKLFDISSKASGQCWSLTTYCPVPGPVPGAPSNRDYAPGFAAAMMLKDLKLAQEAAQSSGATTPLGAQAAGLYSLFASTGAAQEDFSGIVNFLRGERIGKP